MLRRSCIALIVSLVLMTPTAWADETAESAAVSAATSWLELVDGANYAASWDEAAKLFRGAITKEDWKKSLTSVRTPLGKRMSRKLISKTLTTTLPGAPDGKYVVIQFETSFANKKTAIETITPMLDDDGRWRVSGYFIK